MDAKMIAYCGIKCGECPAYLATQADDEAKLAETAKGWSSEEYPVGPDDVICDGCHAERVAKFAPVCATRQCGQEKGVENCAQCGEYICEKLEKHWEMLGEEAKTASKATLDELAKHYKG